MVDWHFPRTELAQEYLDEFETGLANTIVVVSPRRTGKTEFLQRDLLPLARDRGWISISVDFWADPDTPELCLYRGFKEAFDNLPVHLKKSANQWSASSVDFEGWGFQSNSEDTSARSLDELNELWSVFKRLMQVHKQYVLLHLDEVQHLATQKRFLNVTASLRTFLDKNRTHLRSIMTGSNQGDMQRLLHRSTAPFFQAIGIREYGLPELSFVRHQLVCYESLVGKQLIEREAIGFFESINRNPGVFQAIVQDMVKLKVTNFNDAWSVWKFKYDIEKDIKR